VKRYTLPLLAGLYTALAGTAALAASPEALIRQNCAACHTNPANPAGPLTRMQEQRKTPEGWHMTLVRMQQLHKVPFADPDGGSPEDVMRSLVKHFADTQGLAPAESARYRYILEQRLNTIDAPEDPEYRVMCSRCHSEARVGLQRRSETEWRHLVHFHLAQFPTAEYSAGGRDRDWLGTALNRTVPMLAGRYAFDARAWHDWQAAPKRPLDGRWRVFGRMPGKGDFEAVMSATPGAGDTLTLALEGRFADGAALAGSGSAIVYTGYEWRGTIDAGGTAYKQVIAASEDGNTLAGRMFLRDQQESGIQLQATRDDGNPRLLAVQPAVLRAGTTQMLTLVGTNLAGKPDLGAGITVDEVVSGDADRQVLRVTAAAGAATGARAVGVGASRLDKALTVFDRIDRIEVTPAYAVGRVGGNGGTQPLVRATYEALAHSNGADGTAGTADDYAIGIVPAAWSVAPWDEKAAQDRDVEFAGQMDKDSGVFTPAAAGPNPARKYHTNNAGNLKVIALADDNGKPVQGEGRLLVTVQRWNNPPIH
jgi:quinohemoprotein amine dehydrogenase